MPQIRDSYGRMWVVTEYDEVDWAAPLVDLPDLNELSYATLAFMALDGSQSRVLRHVAPLDWRACSEDHMLEWLQMAEPGFARGAHISGNPGA